MKTRVKPGAEIETTTPGEMADLLAAAMHGAEKRTATQRIRATAVISLSAAGAGEADVYTVPAGWEFEIRRVVLDLDEAGGPNGAGKIALDAVGEAIEYLRSGTRIEYGQPEYGSAVQIPGAQTWGREQGPYLRNDETFSIRASGLTANAHVNATVEGILYRAT